MARIYLDARAGSGGTSGVGRYCAGLIPALAAQAPAHEFVVIYTEAPEGQFPPNVRLVAVGGQAGSLALLASAARIHRLIARTGPADLFHALFHLVPFGLRRGRRAPAHVVVTLHDLIWIDHARDVENTALGAMWRRRLGSLAIPYALRTADHVICNSAATAGRASRFVSRSRLTPVHLGLSEEHFVAADPHPPAPPADEPYIAAFGVPKAYKNIAALVRAFARVRETRPRLRLVLIGGDGGAGDAIDRAGLRGQVTITPALPDPAVQDLIRGAEVFAVPSTIEGFGLPVAEAMALGTPVVISSDPALREVAQGAALEFALEDPDALAAALARLLDDEALRRDLAARGRVRASGFRWRTAAAETLAVYDRVLGGVFEGAAS